ncbi:MAG TPA: cytochrome c-type biogenesis protein CcmH [Longimicrobium sp.]|nr:cytochrome c-type biogenesis protein CcmH [Longimicrobium sp.]
MRLRTLLAALAIALLAVSVNAAAQAARTPASEAVAHDAIGRLRSPFCPGLMLEVCPSQPADMLRDSIHDLAAQGRSADDIVEIVLARHGEEWRAVPKRSGAGLWAWLAPPIALIVGGAVVFGWMRSRRDPGRFAGLRPDAAITDEERARLDAALREWESAEAQA